MAKKPQAQDLIQGWMESQQQLWNGWIESLEKAAGGPVSQTWRHGLGNWQEAVSRTLETQLQATRAWADQVGDIEGAPPEVKKWAHDGVDLMERWADTQRSLWQQWFSLMNSAAPVAGSAPGREQLERFMAGWEEAAKRMQDLQRAWAESVTGGKRGG